MILMLPLLIAALYLFYAVNRSHTARRENRRLRIMERQEELTEWLRKTSGTGKINNERRIVSNMNIDYNKYADGLVPAIIQDVSTQKVLMLGFMNEAAFQKTQAEGKVTFFSRSKGRLWTKGEESGHFLLFRGAAIDCDNDSLLIKAEPLGPVCHTGADTCWNEKNSGGDFLFYLQEVIRQRQHSAPEDSYVARMMAKGVNKIAQKVGEEAVELVIEAKDNDRALFLGEAADLLFHYLMLLNVKQTGLEDVIEVLKSRHA